MYDEIKNRLTNIESDVRLIVNTVEANHRSLRGTIDEIKELNKKHDKTLYGNGVKGMTERIGVLECLEDEFRDHTKNDNTRFGGLLTLLVSILALIVWGNFFR